MVIPTGGPQHVPVERRPAAYGSRFTFSSARTLRPTPTAQQQTFAAAAAPMRAPAPVKAVQIAQQRSMGQMLAGIPTTALQKFMDPHFAGPGGMQGVNDWASGYGAAGYGAAGGYGGSFSSQVLSGNSNEGW